MDWSLLMACIGSAGVTVLLYWIPRSARWRESRREQRRTMIPYRISSETFGRIERINEFALPLVGLLVTIGLCIKLATETL